MTTDRDKMREYGYYEVHIPVWNPKSGDVPVNMTVDIYGDEELLDELNIGEPVRNYGNGDVDEMSYYEEIIGNNIRSLIRHDLIMDVYCDEFNISSVDDLKERLDEETFGIFPL